ncbi:MAG TPA: aminodeoxychorismate/anthranilate synthase component II [Candidatus Choladousia intestinigallinarum]|nr:aminodeoxychorismate/anthranilate synthase component II [Candidatus Choladousia intestinigallinarum]
MILLIDNYDSFSYNLYQYLAVLDPQVEVVRNDRITLGEIHRMKPDKIILSPGPGRPEDAGVCIPLVKEFAGEIPILGVCLGHQAIGAAYGASVQHADRLMHGKTSLLTDVSESVLFEGIPRPIQAARYHSLSVRESTLPEEVKVTARSSDGEIMAIEHREYPVYGLQFHPESVLTPEGFRIIQNFIVKERGRKYD